MKKDFEKTIVYAAGPGNIVRTFEKWREGEDDDHQVAVTYSSQFFDLCKKYQFRGVAISSNPADGALVTDQFRVLNMKKKAASNGLQYHLVQAAYMRRILAIAIEEGADYLVISDATGHWFPLSFFVPDHIKIIPTFHCKLWPRFMPMKPVQKVLNHLNRSFFKRHCHRILSISNDVSNQIRQVAKNMPDVHSFIPTYRAQAFRNFPTPPKSDIFRVLFAGRMEENKGVLDLLQMGSYMKKMGVTRIRIDVCGDGPLSDDFDDRIKALGLEGIIEYHGYCHSDEMKAHIRDASAFIVPTTSQFEEGFNKVIAEAVLAGRPVITSKVCPALEWVRPAAVEAPPNDPLSYVMAMIELSHEPEYYRRKQRSCQDCAEPFTNPQMSWGFALQQALGL